MIHSVRITHFGWKMFSSSRWIASGFGLALALSFAIAEEPLAAQATAQDTAQTKGATQMPMNMPMGKKTQKKKTTPKTTKSRKASASKHTAKTGKRSAPVAFPCS